MNEEAVVADSIESEEDWRDECLDEGRFSGMRLWVLREEALRVNEAGCRVNGKASVAPAS